MGWLVWSGVEWRWSDAKSCLSETFGQLRVEKSRLALVRSRRRRRRRLSLKPRHRDASTHPPTHARPRSLMTTPTHLLTILTDYCLSVSLFSNSQLQLDPSHTRMRAAPEPHSPTAKAHCEPRPPNITADFVPASPSPSSPPPPPPLSLSSAPPHPGD